MQFNRWSIRMSENISENISKNESGPINSSTFIFICLWNFFVKRKKINPMQPNNIFTLKNFSLIINVKWNLWKKRNFQVFQGFFLDGLLHSKTYHHLCEILDYFYDVNVVRPWMLKTKKKVQLFSESIKR